MIEYQDLLFAKYKEHDCYRFVIECLKRDGKDLKNLRDTTKVEAKDLQEFVKYVNVVEVQTPKAGDVLQTEYNGEVHLGYMLDSENVLHIVKTGARVTPTRAFKNVRFFEVIK